VCYAETDGTNSDPSWFDSYIRLQISLMEDISSHLVAHETYGQIASTGSSEIGWDATSYATITVTDLDLTYSGTLATSKYISLVDSTLNSNFPCAAGIVLPRLLVPLNQGQSQHQAM